MATAQATQQTLTVGAWSSGTMRAEDIAQTLLDMARFVGIDRDTAEPWATLRIEGAAEDGEAIEEAIDILDEYAPIYCYVGASEHDSADFGVWPSMDAIQYAQEQSVPLVEGGTALVNIDDGVIIDVNDHGNVTISPIERGAPILELV